MNRFSRWPAVLLVAVSGASAAASGTESAPQQKVVAAPAESAQMIFIDPATGEIRAPTVEEWAQLAATTPPKARRIYEGKVLPNGMILLPPEAGMQQITATIAPDGSITTRCAPADAGN